MDFSTWLIFSGIALIAVVSPGPAVLLSVTNSLTHGFSKSLWSSLGNITGLFMVSGMAVLGLGAVLKTSTLLFSLLKLMGAVYLIYLGIRQWRSTDDVFSQETGPGRRNRTMGKSFIQGIFVALSNPKAILFFTALFPQFIALDRPVMTQFMILTATFMIYSFIALCIYAIGARTAREWFARGRRIIWFNRITGAFFITFGVGILKLRNRTT